LSSELVYCSGFSDQQITRSSFIGV